MSNSNPISFCPQKAPLFVPAIHLGLGPDQQAGPGPGSPVLPPRGQECKPFVDGVRAVSEQCCLIFSGTTSSEWPWWRVLAYHWPLWCLKVNVLLVLLTAKALATFQLLWFTCTTIYSQSPFTLRFSATFPSESSIIFHYFEVFLIFSHSVQVFCYTH